VRSAITVANVRGRIVALFGDRRGYAYCVDATTGGTIWKVTPDDESGTLITGAPVLFENRLYVPITNADGGGAGNPAYECCNGRGAVVALDAATGAVIWTTYTTAKAVPQGRNAIGTQLHGPSGASVWSAPTIDARNRVLYVGTGDNHSAPATDTSDAVLALSLDDGKICVVETAASRRRLERCLRLGRRRELPYTAWAGPGSRLVRQSDRARRGQAYPDHRAEVRHGLGARSG
jgi:polyvinyl alcohol dehydrogenase (cytochrome)